MEENKYSELDKLFQSRLNRPKRKEGDWNTPSGDILNEALNKVSVLDQNDREKRRSIPFLWSALAGVLLIAFASFIIFNYKGKSKLEVVETRAAKSEFEKSQPSTFNEEVPSKVTETENAYTAETIVENIIETKPTLTQESRNQENIKLSDTPVGNAVAIKARNQNYAGVIRPMIATANQLNTRGEIEAQLTTQTNSEDVKGSVTQVANKSITTHQNKVASFDALGTLNLSPLFAEFKMDLLAKPIFKEEEAKRQNGYRPYLLVGAQWSTMSMANLEGVDYQLTEYDRNYLGYRLGVGVNQELNSRFAMDYQLVLNGFSNESVYEDEMQYEAANEIITAGREAYSGMFVIASPMGMTEESVTFDLAHGSISDQEQLGNVTNIKQYFTSISFSVGPEFKVINRNRFSLIAKTGLQFNWLARMSQSMDMKIYHQVDMMVQKSFEYNNLDQANQFTYGLNAGLELEYLISDRFFIGLGLEGTRSLNSIRRSVNNDQVKTFIHGYGLSLSTGVKF